MGITRTGTGKVGESEEKKEDSIKDQIYNKIFAGIMNNEFSFDEFLTEKSLMEKYQVSRAPVREALMQLRSDRIIASTPRHGYRIRKPAPGRAAGYHQFPDCDGMLISGTLS